MSKVELTAGCSHSSSIRVGFPNPSTCTEHTQSFCGTPPFLNSLDYFPFQQQLVSNNQSTSQQPSIPLPPSSISTNTTSQTSIPLSSNSTNTNSNTNTIVHRSTQPRYPAALNWLFTIYYGVNATGCSNTSIVSATGVIVGRCTPLSGGNYTIVTISNNVASTNVCYDINCRMIKSFSSTLSSYFL